MNDPPQQADRIVLSEVKDVISVAFAHYSHVFDEGTLIRYSSPHFSDSEAGNRLRHIVLAAARQPRTVHSLDFDPAQIICGNEVFPESAVADPLADLEIWDEWRNGARAFPYPGQYSRLGLTKQEAKTSSSTSTGVIGEILAGLFSQASICPWILVRTIRRWPDFIYYPGKDRYAFVEAKSFHGGTDAPSRLETIQPSLLAECLAEAARQLVSDPFVKVWLAFTDIMTIQPFRMGVVVLELDTPVDMRNRSRTRVMPPPVVAGLAERMLMRAAARMTDEPLREERCYEVEHQAIQLEPLFDLLGTTAGPTATPSSRKQPRSGLKPFQSGLQQRALEAVEEVLAELVPEEIVRVSREEIEREIKVQAKKVRAPEAHLGRRFREAKKLAAEGVLAPIRSYGERTIYLADLPVDERSALESSWPGDWATANQPWGWIDGIPLWRCSSAVLALGGPELDGRSIRGARRE